MIVDQKNCYSNLRRFYTIPRKIHSKNHFILFHLALEKDIESLNRNDEGTTECMQDTRTQTNERKRRLKELDEALTRVKNISCIENTEEFKKIEEENRRLEEELSRLKEEREKLEKKKDGLENEMIKRETKRQEQSAGIEEGYNEKMRLIQQLENEVVGLTHERDGLNVEVQRQGEVVRENKEILEKLRARSKAMKEESDELVGNELKQRKEELEKVRGEMIPILHGYSKLSGEFINAYYAREQSRAKMRQQ